jgi:anti-anti-sigma factor
MKPENIVVRSTTDATGVSVVYVHGFVVTNLGNTSARQEVKNLLARPTVPLIILNLCDINYMDSFSFGWIVRVFKDAQSRGGQLVICCPSDDVVYLFEVTDFAKIVPSYRSEEDAREALLTGNTAKRLVV